MKRSVVVLLLLTASALVQACSGSTEPGDDAGLDAIDVHDTAVVDQWVGTDDGTDARDAAHDQNGEDNSVEPDISTDIQVDDISGETSPWDVWVNTEITHEFEGFNRDDFTPVYGWILLDADRQHTLDAIELGAIYGVNHIQLSHDIIMNIDELLGDDETTAYRVETINLATALAHEKGMKVYLWAHEFQELDFVVCYAPDGAIWETRAKAYRDAFVKIPDVDGIVLMFGSAGASPWFTYCDCAWCPGTFPEEGMNPPPQDVRIQLVIENLGQVITGELGKELIARVFAHEADENPWHADGLARSQGVPFTSMHKSEVGDWQPYNPHDPTLGQVGAHPSILEIDAAGEYFGRSELPFASPTYYRYRLKHAWESTGIGSVARIERGSDRAIGTPNEVNLLTIGSFVQDTSKTIDDVWAEFIGNRYGLTGLEAVTLQKILETTLPVMAKTHYVLGIWALEKGSDIPADVVADQLSSRGNMPKWDADWTDIWQRVKSPDMQTLLEIYHEGTEAVVIAEKAIADFSTQEWTLSVDDRADLLRRLTHQYWAARAWRGVELMIFGVRAAANDPMNVDFIESWLAWVPGELETVAAGMETDGLATVSIASPARIRTFITNAASKIPDVEPVEPPPLMTAPLTFTGIGTDSVTISFDAPLAGTYIIEFGTEFPHFDQSVEVVTVMVANPDHPPVGVTINNLTSDTRYIFRLKLDLDGGAVTGGDYWAMTRNMIP